MQPIGFFYIGIQFDYNADRVSNPVSVVLCSLKNGLEIKYHRVCRHWGINNPVFNSPEFEGIKNEVGLNRFTLSVKKWIEKTNAIGLIAKK